MSKMDGLPDGFDKAVELPWQVARGGFIDSSAQQYPMPSGPVTVWFGVDSLEGAYFMVDFAGGTRFARISPQTDFGLEEHFDGTPPPADTKAFVEQAWKALLGGSATVANFARAEAERRFGSNWRDLARRHGEEEQGG